ncbi:MAG: hypothetical protein OEZ34_17245 [Spirochaetia bacterium]|nr:hypothetical protein [Spirochaetia bacterium]
MKEIEDFSLEGHQGPYEKWPLKTRLFYKAEETGTFISGFVIEKQYSLNNEFYFLIASYDCPFEESNEFYLLDKNFKIKSRRSLIFPYESYLLMNVEIFNEKELLLEYASKVTYKLTLHPGASWFQRKIKLKNISGLDGAFPDQVK